MKFRQKVNTNSWKVENVTDCGPENVTLGGTLHFLVVAAAAALQLHHGDN